MSMSPVTHATKASGCRVRTDTKLNMSDRPNPTVAMMRAALLPPNRA